MALALAVMALALAVIALALEEMALALVVMALALEETAETAAFKKCFIVPLIVHSFN